MQDEPLLNEEGVVLVAQAVAKSQGILLNKFKKPTTQCYRDGDHGTWYVNFKGKNNRYPGNWFFVRVNDRTGEAVLIGGR
jgi:hypothetical protein